MKRNALQPGAWIVVCDGAKALILENKGDEKFPNLRTREVHEQENPRTHEQGTEPAGRVAASVGSARSAVETPDYHQQNETAFLKRLVEQLDRAAAEHSPPAITVVAPPRAMGVLRTAYTARLRALLREEVEKDYVKMPVHEIEKRLTAG